MLIHPAIIVLTVLLIAGLAGYVVHLRQALDLKTSLYQRLTRAFEREVEYLNNKLAQYDRIRIPKNGEDCPDSVRDWMHENIDDEWEVTRDEGIVIHTLEGDMKANPGDYIIKGVQGECYPCKPDIFHETYERVSG